jgi:hypothetical protein
MLPCHDEGVPVARPAVLDDVPPDAAAPAPARRTAARPGALSPVRLRRALGYRLPVGHLHRRERHVLVAIGVLAVVAAGAAWVHALVATTSFFEGGPSDREQAVQLHDQLAAAWAAFTPACAWVVLRRSWWSWAGVAVWTVLLVVASPWWWPGAPQHAVDLERPVWHHAAGTALWALLLASVAIGVWCAWRATSRAALRRLAVVTGIAVVGLGIGVRVHLEAHVDADRAADTGQPVTVR